MKSDLVRQITLYKYRYPIGFGVLLLFILAVAAWRFWALPSGLSEAEMASAAAAGHFSAAQIFDNVVNLPWTVLEWISIKLFGATTLAFRLPAVILMILSAVGLVIFLKRWTRNNIAVISSFWAVTSILFISLARSGTPAAMTTFLIVMILLSTQIILRAVETMGSDKAENQIRRNWQTLLAKIVLCVALALLCYQAAGIYLVILLVAVGAIHPKTRLVFLKSKPWKISVGTAVGLLVVAPLVIGLALGGRAALGEWLVLNGAWSLEHLGVLGSTLAGFDASSVGGVIIPVITLVALVVAFLGLIKICADILSARSYLTLPLLMLTLVLTAWQPTLVYLLFIPLVLLTTVGLETLVREWYDLFPRNPYARILAVVPLAILIAGLGWTSISRFGLGQNYDSSVVYHYNQEFSAVRDTLASEKDAATLVAAPDEKDFYAILQRDFPNLEVVDSSVKPSSGRTVIVLASAEHQIEAVPKKIITKSRIDNAVLLRVY
jgi:hypothetical protein